MDCFLLALLVLFSFPQSSHALVFHLSSGAVKCFSEDLRAGAMSLAHFRVADDPPSPHNISASMMDPNGENLHRVDTVESGQFVIVAAVTGKHTTCFWSSHFHLQTSVTVDFEWRTGIVAKDWTYVANKGKIHEMNSELKKLDDSINSIREEMIFLRNREEEARSLNETTTSRMQILTILSFIVCMGVAGLQFWHLKTFFEREDSLERDHEMLQNKITIDWHVLQFSRPISGRVFSDRCQFFSSNKMERVIVQHCNPFM